MSEYVESGSLDFLLGGGEMGRMIRAFDWSSTALGNPCGWPQSLRSALSICLHSSFPTAIYWGNDLCLLYNDAWAPIPADRHPHVLGRPAREVWAGIWDVVGPQLENTIRNAQGFSAYDQMLMMERGYTLHETYWNYSFTPIRGENGVVGGVFNQGHEVTDRILAERHKAAELVRQRRMFEQAPGFIAILGSSEHRFEFVNQSYTRLFGERKYIGKTIYEAFPELEGQGFYEWLEMVFRSGQRLVQHRTPIQLERPGAPSEQRFLDFIYEPLLDESGSVTGIFCEGFDVTDAHISRVALEASEAALREQTHTLETLNRVSAELAGDLDLNRIVQSVTDAGREMTGAQIGAYFHNHLGDGSAQVTLSVAPRFPFTHLSSPTAPSDFTTAFVDHDVVRSDDISQDVRFNSLGAHFGFRHLLIRSYLAVPVVSQSGEILGGLIYGHTEPGKFTHRHERLSCALASQAAIAIDKATLFQQVQSANEMLEQRVEARSQELSIAHAALRQTQKMEAIGQLTGGIAHDFNNLLAGIMGSLEMIERRFTNGRLEGLNRYLNAAQDSASRAALLTQRLLAFSRRQTLDPKPTDVNQLVIEVEQLASAIIGPSITTKVVMGQDLWRTKIDASQLENSLIHLVINARDAMPEGGEITIQTLNVGNGDLEGSDTQLLEGDFVLISVSDSGTGIAPEIMEKIFDPFFSTKPIGQGTGLGLSMIHGFVNQSGGGINVNSCVGSGTTISLYLPRHVGQSEPVSSEPSSNIHSTGDLKVVVIDDERNIRMLMSDALREQGYTVSEAENGATGLQVLQSLNKVDILVTDVGLPGGMNGRQLADSARLSLPNLRVLFVTGYADGAAVDGESLETGMSVLIKPFTLTEFTSKVRQMLVE